MSRSSNGQQALWTFLMFTLVAPFAGAVLIGAAAGLVRAIGLAGPWPDPAPPIGMLIIDAYVWAAIPAALTGALMAALVHRNGSFTWLEVAVASIIAFFAAYLLAPFSQGGLLAVFAFAAGMVGIAVRAVLIAARIVRP